MAANPLISPEMIVDDWTIIKTEDKIIFQINHAWLDEWPEIDSFRRLPPGVAIIETLEDGIEFIREQTCPA